MGGERLFATGRLCTAVALELAPGLMWAAGRLGPWALDGGPGLAPTTRDPTRRANQLHSAGEADSDVARGGSRARARGWLDHRPNLACGGA